MAIDRNVHPPRIIRVVAITLGSWLASILAGMIGLRPLVRVLSALSASEHNRSISSIAGRLSWWQICIVALLSVTAIIAGVAGVRASVTGYRMQRERRLSWAILLLADVFALLYLLLVIGAVVVSSLILNRL